MTAPLAERLRHADPAERRAACRAAPADPAAALHLEALVAALGDPDPGVAEAASRALAELGRGVKEVAPLLRAALRGHEPRRRIRSALTLAQLEPPHPGLLPALVEGLSAAEGPVRWAAARLLTDTGRLHGEVLPLLLALLGGPAPRDARRMAAFCLRELAPDRPEAARVLLAATRDEDAGLRRAALTALAALEGPPPEVVERLVEALDGDPDAAARRVAAAALGEAGAQRPELVSPGARARLRAAAEPSQDPELQRAARQALARLEPDAGP